MGDASLTVRWLRWGRLLDFSQGCQSRSHLAAAIVRGRRLPGLYSRLRTPTTWPLRLQVVPARRLVPCALPMVPLGLLRRPQGVAGWARGEGHECPTGLVFRRAEGSSCVRCARVCGCGSFRTVGPMECEGLGLAQELLAWPGHAKGGLKGVGI